MQISNAKTLTSGLAVTLALGLAGEAAGAGPLPPVGVSAAAGDGTAGCVGLFLQPGIGGVDVAANARGDTIVSWTRNAGGGTQMVQASFRPAGGSFGPPQNIGHTGPCYRLGFAGATPDVALDGQGGAVIVFQGDGVARAAVKPPGGAFGAPVDLASALTTLDDGPRVAMNPTGTAVAVWSRRSGSDTIVQSSTRPPGGAFGSPVNLSALGSDAHDARVAVNDAGAAAVAWVRHDGTADRAQARVRPAGQSAFAQIRDLSTPGTAAQGARQPDVGLAANGVTTAVWSRFVDGDNRIQARDLDAAGSLVAGIDDITELGDEREAPDLAVDPSGAAVVVFRGCASGGCLVKAATRPAGGVFGTAGPISPETDSNVLPQVAIDSAGVATAVFAPFLAPGPILLTRRPPGGSFGAVQPVSPTGGGSLSPSLATDDEGNVLVGWSFHSSSPAGLWTAQVSAFDAAAPTLRDVAVPSIAGVGQGVDMAAVASDRWSPVSLSWSFGDGATVLGGAVAHAFGSPGAFPATVTAADAAGNSSSDTRSILVTPPAPAARPAKQVIRSKVRVTWGVRGEEIFLLRLQVTGVPKGGKVELRCLKRGKRKCPFKRRTSKKRRNGTITLFKEVKPAKAQGTKQRSFRAGQRLELRITKKDFIGKVVRYDLKKGKIPSGKVLCLSADADKPRARC